MSEEDSPSISQESTPQPWHRLPEENNRWYTRFSQYLALGAARSVRAAYNAEKGNEQKKSVPASWREASQRFHWQERAQAYDRWQRRAVFADRNAIDPTYLQKLEGFSDLLDRLHMHLVDELTNGRANDKLVAQYFAGMAIYAKLTETTESRRAAQASNERVSIEGRPQEKPFNVVFYMPEVGRIENDQTVVPALREPAASDEPAINEPDPA